MLLSISCICAADLRIVPRSMHPLKLLARLRFTDVLGQLLLGFLSLVDRSLGACYFVLDIAFEGLEAYKTKDIIIPHDLCLTDSKLGINGTVSGCPGTDLSQRVGRDSKPRRAGIIATRKNAKRLHCNETSQLACSSTCWGWEIKDPLDDHKDDTELSKSNSEKSQIRWSECQCPDCAKLWMPMRKARSRLHVQTCDRNVGASPAGSNVRFNSSSNPVDDHKTARFDNPAGASATGSDDRVENSNRQECSPVLGSLHWRNSTGVIFLHGMFSSSDFWFDSNIIPMLNDSIKSTHLILAPDLLGCARSPRTFDGVYTLRDQIEALETSLVKKHNLDSFHIVGHSMGTVPAVALAGRFQDRLRSLTLIAPVYSGYTDGSGKQILTDCNSILSFQDPWSVQAIRSVTASHHYNINRFVGHLLFSRHKFLVPIFQRMFAKRWPGSFVRDYLTVTHDAAWHIVHNTMVAGSHALVPALQKLRDRGKRVLVVHGTNDTSCPFERSLMMAQHFNNVVLAAVPGRGHVDVVLGHDAELVPLLQREIGFGDANFCHADFCQEKV